MSELEAIKALSRETKALILVSEFEARRMPLFQLRTVLELLVNDPLEQKAIIDMVENDLRATGYPSGEVSAFLSDLLSTAPPKPLSPEEGAVLTTRRLRSPFAAGFEGGAPATDAEAAPAVPAPQAPPRLRGSKVLPAVPQQAPVGTAPVPPAPPRPRPSTILPTVPQQAPVGAAPVPQAPQVAPRPRSSTILPAVSLPAPEALPFFGRGKTIAIGPPPDIPPHAGTAPVPPASQAAPKPRASSVLPTVSPPAQPGPSFFGKGRTSAMGIPVAAPPAGGTAPPEQSFFGKGRTSAMGIPVAAPPAGGTPQPEQPFFGKGRTVLMGPQQPDARTHPPPPFPAGPPSTPPSAGAQRRSTFVVTSPPVPTAAGTGLPTPSSPDALMPVGQRALLRHEMLLGGKGATAGPPIGPKPLVLIADDDKRARMVFRIRIEEAGYETVEYGTGDEAWERIRQGGVALAVLDMKMPGLHGLEVLSNIADKCPDLPVVICTAYDQLQEEFAVKTYPKLKYLVKPIAPEALVQAIRELLAAKSKA